MKVMNMDLWTSFAPETVTSELPGDRSAVRAHDALLDLLGGADCMPGDLDDELAWVLASWRREVHVDSDRLLVDTDTALAVIRAARRIAADRADDAGQPMSGPARWAYSMQDDVLHLLAPGSDRTLGLVVNGDKLAVRCGERRRSGPANPGPWACSWRDAANRCRPTSPSATSHLPACGARTAPDLPRRR